MARMTACTDSLGVMTFGMFGRTNNNIKQLTHMLWYSRMSKRKLYIPVSLHWVHTLFDTSALRHRYCFEFATEATNTTKATVVGTRQSYHLEGLPVTDGARAEIFSLTAELFAQPRDPMRDFAVVCKVVSAIHLRWLEGSCPQRVARLNRTRSVNEICHMPSNYIRDQLHNCSTDHVFLATDDQQPKNTKRIIKDFRGWQYKGRNAIIVDLMALSYAHKAGCALLNPASSFTRNAHAISTNPFGWCTRNYSTDRPAAR